MKMKEKERKIEEAEKKVGLIFDFTNDLCWIIGFKFFIGSVITL